MPLGLGAHVDRVGRLHQVEERGRARDELRLRAKYTCARWAKKKGHVPSTSVCKTFDLGMPAARARGSNVRATESEL
eukprot:7386461-Prymnesium_polylepis.3